MDRLKRERTTLRTKLTRLVNSINPLLRTAEPDTDALQAKSEMLQAVWRGLEDADIRIHDLMLDDADVDEEELEAEQQVIDQYEESYLTLKIKLQKILEPPVTPVVMLGTQGGGVSVNKRTFQLPKIKPMTFDGDYKSWLTWWAQFKKIHEDPDLDLSDKSHYLLDAMKEETEARSIVMLYLQSSDNYHEAVDALKECYGRDGLQLQYYVGQMLKLVITNVSSENKLPLGSLYLQLESHLRCLNTLKLDKADPATWLFPMVESSLSKDTLWAWQRSSLSKQDGSTLNPPRTRLDFLMEFIKGEVRTEQQICMAQSAFQSTSISEQQHNNKDNKGNGKTQTVKKTEEFSTAAGLISNEVSCGFCDGRHDTDRCVRAQAMTLVEKKDKLKAKNLCFSCLYTFHPKKPCKVPVRCIICGKPHHSLMCGGSIKKTELKSQGKGQEEDSDSSESSTENESAPNVSASSANLCSSDVLLNILQVKVIGKKGRTMIVRMVGDSACQRSYVTEELVKKLKLKSNGKEYVQNVLFGNIATAPILHKRITVPLSSLDGENKDEKVLLQKNQICGALPKVPYGPWIEELRQRGIRLSDEGQGSGDVDVLLGSDKWNSILIKDKDNRVISYMTDCGLLAVQTIFGWTVSGPLPSASNIAVAVTSSMLCVQSDMANLSIFGKNGGKELIRCSLSRVGERKNPSRLASATTPVRRPVCDAPCKIGRECNPKEMLESSWWEGTTWLKENEKTAKEEKSSAHRVVVTKRGRVIRTPARYGAWLHLVKK